MKVNQQQNSRSAYQWFIKVLYIHVEIFNVCIISVSRKTVLEKLKRLLSTKNERWFSKMRLYLHYLFIFVGIAEKFIHRIQLTPSKCGLFIWQVLENTSYQTLVITYSSAKNISSWNSNWGSVILIYRHIIRDTSANYLVTAYWRILPIDMFFGNALIKTFMKTLTYNSA